MSKRVRARLSIDDSREAVRIASLNTGDLSVRVDADKAKIFFLGPREQVLDARDIAQQVLDDIEQEATIYFNADPEDLPHLRGTISQIVKRCRIESDKLHHEVFVSL